MKSRINQFTSILVMSFFLFQGCEKDKVSYTLTINSYEARGTVNLEPIGQYKEGEIVIVEATPDLYYSFSSWTGDISSTDNPLSLLMDSNKEITPVFTFNDADGDGVPDEIDQCPDTAEGVSVDSKGCDRNNLIVLAENGITVMAGEESVPGDSKIINGKLYTVVDRKTLYDAVDNGEDVSGMVTSKINFMKELFKNAVDFNQNISSWDVSQVTSMHSIFSRALLFNQDIGHWDVSNVTDMTDMFKGAIAFNQNISNWNVSKVTHMNDMFSTARKFNQDIGHWDVSNVIRMSSMFEDATAFNQVINGWNVSQVTTMWYMFSGAKDFNQNLNSWNVSQVTDMKGMFYNATSFNQDISGWNVSRVGSMVDMFMGAVKFNQDLSNWNVNNVEYYMRFSYNTPDWTLSKPTFL